MKNREIVIRIQLPRAPRTRWLVGGVSVVLFSSALVYAALIQFSPATPIKSADVNSNFANLDTRVAALEAKNTVIGAGPQSIIVSAQIHNNGSACSITSQDGSWISSAVRSGQGTCLLTFATGTFTGVPRCVNSGLYPNDWNPAPTTTQVGVTSLNVSGGTYVTVDADFHIICMGAH